MQQALITGASGFLGKYIVRELKASSIPMLTLGRQHADIVCGLSKEVPKLAEAPNWVVHAAGKAHVVPKTAAEEQEFFQVNLEGTKHLCRAFDSLNRWPTAFIFISTVAVYGVEEGVGINEEHALEGNTPYAKSKIEAERFLTDWCEQRKVKLTILRLPLIAGSNPPGNLGAMIKGIRTNRYFNIGDGSAQKSIVMASDVAKIIPVVAGIGGIYNLTDGKHPSFADLASLMARQLGKKPPMSIPRWIALPMALAGNFLGSKAPINTAKLQKITATLIFDDSKARRVFGWNPAPVLQAFRLEASG